MTSKGLMAVLAAIRPEMPVLSTFGAESPISPSRYQISEHASSSFPRAVVASRLKSLNTIFSTPPNVFAVNVLDVFILWHQFSAGDFPWCYCANPDGFQFFLSVSSGFTHVFVKVFWNPILIDKLLQAGHHLFLVINNLSCAECDYTL